jgi:hypothetical protein
MTKRSKLGPVAYVLQGLAYTAFALFIAAFADGPAYTHFDPERALIKLSFVHSGQRKAECKRLTPKELAKLPLRDRRPLDCPRERLPVLVEMHLDDAPIYRELVQPTGLAGGGTASVYHRVPVDPGTHRLELALRDSARSEGFDYTRTATVALVPREVLVIDFRPETGGFILKKRAAIEIPAEE